MSHGFEEEEMRRRRKGAGWGIRGGLFKVSQCLCLDAYRKDGICTQMKVDISVGLHDWRGDEESHCLFSFILTVSPSLYRV